MGWSFAVTCRSSKAQVEMLAFLEEHYIPTSRLFASKWADHWRYQHPKLPGAFTKYASTKTSIGFDSPTDHEQAVLRWVALRAGKKRTFKKKLGAEHPSVPWVNMDGDDMLPVILRSQWDGEERTEQYVVDGTGFQPVSRFGVRTEGLVGKALAYMLDRMRETDEKDLGIAADLKRLDALWEAR